MNFWESSLTWAVMAVVIMVWLVVPLWTVLAKRRELRRLRGHWSHVDDAFESPSSRVPRPPTATPAPMVPRKRRNAALRYEIAVPVTLNAQGQETTRLTPVISCTNKVDALREARRVARFGPWPVIVRRLSDSAVVERLDKPPKDDRLAREAREVGEDEEV